jgi:ubiquinone/menaquinone biosynthesis C-methylase UbiE
MTEARRTYLPAAGRDWFLPLYDPIVKLLGGDSARRALLDQAAIRPGHRVLDIGCGTGSLVVLIKRLHPEVHLVGIDPDPMALARGRRKAERAAVSIQFDQGFSDELPYREASFDRVFSTFMFHHLRPEEKERTLREVRRVLEPGGFFHMLDFGGPESGADGFLTRVLHSSHRLRDNGESRVLALMSQAGLADAKQVGHRAMLFGRIVYYQASVVTSEAGVARRDLLRGSPARATA